ncbi:MAG: hypothetical protein C0429_13135 [Sphingopyxis sp.]|nr:hypothetical protein [Sphingopyxis sp.]
MKHDPSMYIGIGKDGILPLESADPLTRDITDPAYVQTDLAGGHTNQPHIPYLGTAVVAVLFVLLAYLFLTI